MKNYISVNAKHYKKREINRISEHNFRLQKIGYLLPKAHIKYDNINIIYDNTNIIYDNKIDENKLTKLGQYTQNLNEVFNKKELDNTLKSQYELLLNKKEKIQYKNKSYAKSNESTLVEMVVALSEEQALNYLESGQDLGKGFDNFTKNLCEKYGFTPLQVSLHLDEGYIENGIIKNNIHAHLTLFNFDFEKERSVLRTLKKQDYKDLQDLAANSFKEVGFDFQRGASKELSTKEHLERNDFILSKQKQQIEEQIKEINTNKNELKSQLKLLEKGSEEYNELYSKIGKLQQEEKQLRESKKEIENIKSFKDQSKIELVELFKNHIKDSKVHDSKAFINDIYKLIHKNNNVNFKENNDLKQENQDLKDKLQNKDEVLEKVMTEKYEAIRENKILNQKDLSRTNEMTKLEENHKLEIKRLRNDFKRQVAIRVRRLNLINRLRRSNIAQRIRNRLSKKLNSNSNSNQRDR